jgi:hypothetical protein
MVHYLNLLKILRVTYFFLSKLNIFFAIRESLKLSKVSIPCLAIEARKLEDRAGWWKETNLVSMTSFELLNSCYV